NAFFFFFSSRRRHTRWPRDWSSDVCSSDLLLVEGHQPALLVPQLAQLEGEPGVRSRHAGPVKQRPQRSVGQRRHQLEGEGDRRRSEERRVGKEGRSRWWEEQKKKKEKRNRN